jgi:type IV pilus assembly protein PilA
MSFPGERVRKAGNKRWTEARKGRCGRGTVLQSQELAVQADGHGSGTLSATVLIDRSDRVLPDGDEMRTSKGFSLIEMLIVVAIILIIMAIAVPSFLQSRIAANESAAAATIRTLNSAQISYNSAYPTVGYASSLATLGGVCTGSTVPTSTSACLIDGALQSGTRSGYTFLVKNVSGSPAGTYNVMGSPVLTGYSGNRNFCSYDDAVVRVSMSAIATCDGTVSPQQ